MDTETEVGPALLSLSLSAPKHCQIPQARPPVSFESFHGSRLTTKPLHLVPCTDRHRLVLQGAKQLILLQVLNNTPKRKAGAFQNYAIHFTRRLC